MYYWQLIRHLEIMVPTLFWNVIKIISNVVKLGIQKEIKNTGLKNIYYH